MLLLRRNKMLASVLLVMLLFCCCYFISSLSSGKDNEDQPVSNGYIDETHVRVSGSARSNIKIEDYHETDYPNQVDVMGKISIAENRLSVISSRVSGRIESVMVNSGEAIHKGQMLVRIFSPDFAATREEYLQAMKQNGSDFKLLSSMSRRKLFLLGLSEDDINHLANSDPNYLTVRSPVSGFILDKKAVLGNSVAVGDVLFTVGNFDKVWFYGDVYQEDLPRIHNGQDVVIDSIGSELDTPLRGKISFISPVIDPTTHTIKIRVLMDNPKEMLRADMYVQAHVIISMSRAVLLPVNAVLQFDGGNYVFRQSSDSGDVFERVEVQVAGKYRNKIVIKSGLNESGKVVTEGGLLLNAIIGNGDNTNSK